MPCNLQRACTRAGEDVGCATVNLLSPWQYDLVGDCLLRERMPPAIGRLPTADLFEQLLRDADGERTLDGRVGSVGDGDECRVVERPPEHRRGLENLRFGSIETSEAQQDRVAHRLGNPHLSWRPLFPALRRAEDIAAVDRLPQHLLEHERISLGARVHQVAESRSDLVLVENRGDHLGDLGLLEGGQRDQLRDARAAPRLQERRQWVAAVELVAAVGDEDERARIREAARDVVEQLPRGRIGPVNVLQDEEQAALARG